MELALAIPLGLLFSGAVESYKRPLYAFAAVVMAMSLVATNSRGGIISLGAEIFFVIVIAGFGWRRKKEQTRGQRVRAAIIRAGLASALVVVFLGGALAISGPEVFTRFLGTPLAEDPTTGRAHFWNVTLDVIKAYPVLGSGLGSFSVIYTRYDTKNGLYRLEQVHNDYLQTLSDAGVIGAFLGIGFIVILFRRGFARRETHDKFRRGVTTGALAGCFAVLIHSEVARRYCHAGHACEHHSSATTSAAAKFTNERRRPAGNKRHFITVGNCGGCFTAFIAIAGLIVPSPRDVVVC